MKNFDEKLTAYALGELSESEKSEIEKQIKNDPKILKEVEEIRQMSAWLKEELSQEPLLKLSPKERNSIDEHFQKQNGGFTPYASPFQKQAGSGLMGVISHMKQSQKKWLSWNKSLTVFASLVLAAGIFLLSHKEGNKVSVNKKMPPLPANEAREEKISFTGTYDTVGKPTKSSPNKTKKSSGYFDMDGLGYRNQSQDFNTESYDRIEDNIFLGAKTNPLSTFSIDVDTASYSNMRRFINQNQLPPKDAVRIEELVNYFNYNYSPPMDDKPFAVHTEIASAPWAPEHRLMKIGIKGREIPEENRKSANLVFLLDVSGSMNSPNKLPLVKNSLKLLVNNLKSKDRIAIVVYAGSSGLVLPSTSASQKEKILEALDNLQAGGSTNGGEGIELAYKTAQANFIRNGINRVVLATDGDFNVGTTNQGDLTRLIEEKAKSGVFLSVLGFGIGNTKDSTMEKLADKGNGNYAYIDNLSEARKVLVEQMGGTLVTLAKDVKIQVEFNPALVSAYRLVGYENRMLKAEDFNNDKVDAGEIGAGHTVTALYEIVPVGVKIDLPKVDSLKYQKVQEDDMPSHTMNHELLTVKLRYKEPTKDVSQLIEFPVVDAGEKVETASADFKFASAVAGFGMILRDSAYKGNATFDSVLKLAQEGVANDPSGIRYEFVSLITKAKSLKNEN